MESNIQQFMAMSPILITSLTLLTVLLIVAWRREHSCTVLVSTSGLSLALFSMIWIVKRSPTTVGDLLIFDSASYFYMGVILVSTLISVFFSYVYLGDEKNGFLKNREEYYLLIILSVIGALTLVSANHFASFFIGVELLSVPIYGLISYTLSNKLSLEAGIKYMLLSAAASAFLLFGISLLYAEVGSLEFTTIHSLLSNSKDPQYMSQLGLSILFVGLGFKLSLVPFHLWTPDVYEGSPAPVTIFLSTVAKVAVFVGAMRIFKISSDSMNAMLLSLNVIAIASIIFGNLLALMQTNIKRILGYSSIAHFGYLLIALIASKGESIETINIYMIAYVLGNLGSLGVISLVSSPYNGHDASNLNQYKGLFWRHPSAATVLTLMMLSLAGVPLTSGFIGKLYVMIETISSHHWWLLASLILGSAIGVFYYLRVMINLYLTSPDKLENSSIPAEDRQRVGIIILLVIAALTLILGIHPQPMIDLVEEVTLVI